MENRSKTFLFLIAISFSFNIVWGSSVIRGGEITYRSVDTARFEVTLKLIRECTNDTFNMGDFYAFNASSSLKINLSNITLISKRDISGIGENCPGVMSKCDGGIFPYSYKEYVWTAELDLRLYTQCEWEISYSNCCRSSSITTGQASTNFFIKSNLNNCLGGFNNSPVMNNYPTLIAFENRELQRSFGAIDTLDLGDSLSFHLVPAYLNRTQMAGTIGSYSSTRPISFHGYPNYTLPFPYGFHLNPITGLLSCTPIVSGNVGVICIEVREWRIVDGVMTQIGSVQREYTVSIVNHVGRKVPSIQNPSTVFTYPNKELRVDFIGIDVDLDSVSLDCVNEVNYGQFSMISDSIGRGAGLLNWTPEKKHIRYAPYVFTIKAQAKKCPLPSVRDADLLVYVIDEPEVSFAHSVLSCGRIALSHQYIGERPYEFEYEILSEANEIVWRSNQMFDTATLTPGFYPIQIRFFGDSIGSLIIRDSVTIGDYLQVNLREDTTVCFGELLSFQVNNSNGIEPIEYEWKRVTDSSFVNTQSASFTARIEGSIGYVVRVTDSMRCVAMDTLWIQSTPRTSSGIDATIEACPGVKINLDASVDPNVFSWLWDNGYTGSVRENYDAGVYWVRYHDVFGCEKTDTIQVIRGFPTVTLGPDTSICRMEELIVFANGADEFLWFNAEDYNYGGNNVPIGIGDSIRFFFESSFEFVVEGYRITNGVKCQGTTGRRRFDIKELPNIDLGSDIKACGGDTVSIKVQSDSLYSYYWSTSEFGDSISVNLSGLYWIKAVGMNGCIGFDSMHLDFHQPSLTIDSIIFGCYLDSVSLNVIGLDSVLWFDLDDYVPGQTNLPVSINDYFEFVLSKDMSLLINGFERVTDGYCMVSDTVDVLRFSQIPISIIAPGQQIFSNRTYTYIAQSNGHINYYWEVINGNILYGQDSGHVIIQWDNVPTGELKLVARDSNGCYDELILSVNITANFLFKTLDRNINLYPNPGKGLYTLEYSGNDLPLRYVIINALGQKVVEGVVSEKISTIVLENARNGVYLFILEDGSRITLIKE